MKQFVVLKKIDFQLWSIVLLFSKYPLYKKIKKLQKSDFFGSRNEQKYSDYNFKNGIKSDLHILRYR